MTDAAEKWKARAREIVGSPLSPQGEYITAHGWMKLQEQIAAALAAAYAEGEKYGWQRGHSAATAAIRARSYD